MAARAWDVAELAVTHEELDDELGCLR